MTSPIRNTTTDPATPFLVLLDGLDGNGGSGAIKAMEKQGQQQLVNSDRLPTNGNNGDRDGNDDAYLALGFTFGEPDADDPMFRPATLPSGWKREASDHDMWSYIVDELGRRRVAIFYKAAFYDRSAFMRLETPHSYCYSALYGDREPIVDGSWLTAEVAVQELTELRDRFLADAERDGLFAADEKAGGQADYWREEAAKGRRRAALANELIERITP